MKLPPVLERIGNTPLIEVSRLNPYRPRVRILAKLESQNPGGSVKDRAALWMVRAGLEAKELVSGKTIIDATSGNTGISLAMIGAALGFPVELVMPAMASDERKRILQAFGAKIVLTPPEEGQDGAILRVRDIVKNDPGRYFYPDQYSNPTNPLAHYESTGPEIWSQTNGEATHFVAGLGTSGTVMGAGRYLREKNRAIRVLGVEPSTGFHGIEGLKHMGTSIVPVIFRPGELSGRIEVETEAAYERTRELARTEGLFVGPSSGAALEGVLQFCKRLPDSERATIVTIFPDSGLRYLSTALWGP